MRLCDHRRAAPAGVSRPPGDEHAQLCRDQVEPLRDIFADPGHLTTAAGAKNAVRLDDALHPRQMRGQLATVAVVSGSAAGPLTFDGGFGLFLRGVENALGDLDILQRQVALVGTQLFGFGAELVAPELADNHLEPAPRLFHLGQSRLMLGKRNLRLRQKRLQPGILCGQGGDVHGPLQSQTARRRHRGNPH
jgi:hypothetical protein